MAKHNPSFVIFPYRLVSKGASALADYLGCLRVRENGNYKPYGKQLIINWGNPRKPAWGGLVSGVNSTTFVKLGGKVMNHWLAVSNAIDKLKAQELFSTKGVPCPRYTTDKQVAATWFNEKKGIKVVCRTLLQASEGRGIVIAKSAEELVNAPLYTMFFTKDTEYRVHVVRGKVIDVQEKRLKKDALKEEGRSSYIRNTANGWVFCREDVNCPDHAKDAAIKAVEALYLDFGAVDIAINTKGDVCVFEVNTAPGLEGTTVNSYGEAFKEIK